jgi:3-dehydroshikimate dehydratase
VKNASPHIEEECMKIPKLIGVFAITMSMGANANTLVVNKTEDDGSKHTLRWAILESNADGSGNRILIIPTVNPQNEWVIKVNSLLPNITAPVVIEGGSRGNRGTPEVIIDGSNVVDVTTTNSCPAENGVGSGPNVRSLQKPGLAVVDSGNVEISGLEIRNFCIGIMLLRSHDNHVHHNVIHDMVGAAGVMITGDDGTAAGGSTIGLSTDNLVEWNVIYDTGDGGECTRGTSNTTYQHNVFFQSSPNTVSPRSQGVECAGNGNTGIQFLYNSFTGYSDGLQLNTAANVTVIGNVITNSTYGITTSGAGVLIRDNTISGNRMGVGPGGNARATITQNRIFNNGQPILSLPTSAGGTTNPASPALLGIDLGVNGVTPNDSAAACADGAPDCDTGPNELQNFPVLSAGSSWAPGGTITLQGSLASRPNATFTIEFFASHSLNAAGLGEGEVYIGTTTVTTNAAGNASFNFVVPNGNPLHDGSTAAFFTATATSAAGSTSEFSAPISLAR